MIFNMVGGGVGGAGGGATLVVSSPANISVTVSKDDKSYTKNSGSLGSTIFKGLATGIWTVTISGNGQIATKTIEITADYAITIAFFSATINITYPANSTCIVTDSTGQTVASDTNSTSSKKTFTAIVGAIGTYTVTATATDGSGDEASKTVEITTEGQSVGVELIYTLVLFNSGDNTEVTGGWVSSGKGETITVGTTVNGAVSGTNNSSTYRGLFSTLNTVQISQRKKLEIKVTTATRNNITTDWQFGIFKTSSNSKPSYVASVTTNSTGTYAIDVSGISGDYYVGFSLGFIGGSGRSGTLAVSKVIFT